MKYLGSNLTEVVVAQQVGFDFSRTRPLIQDGKKEARIPTACSPEFLEFVKLMAHVQGTTVSEMTHRYIVKGLKEDIGDKFMPEPHLDKTLRELLAKFSG